MIEFLMTIQKLKQTKRTGWLNHKVAGPESIADHMHRMGIISLLIKDPHINKDRLVKMAIVHDLAEAIVGDFTPGQISNDQKHQLEWEGIDELVKQLNNSPEALEIKELWTEYEEGVTETAKLCKDIDKFEMIMQAYEYEVQDPNLSLDSFFESTRGKFNHPEIIELVQDLYKLRQK